MTDLDDETINGLIKWSLESAGECGPHITRFAMYKALENALAAEDSPSKRGLAISLSRPFARDILGLRKTQFTDANYPECNILNLPFDSATFDFCVSDQVLEHVEGDPVAAFQESARVVKAGGFICHTTCFMNEVHGVPRDFWRFTTDALALMAQISNCRTVIVSGWGNREAWALIRRGFRFSRIPLDSNHPLHKLAVKNEKDVPIVVWIIAQKYSDETASS